MRRAVALALTALVTLPACGASYQARYEADVHFARCYRIDAEPGATRDQRLGCWNGWRNAYAGTQTRDRDEHAARRVSQLERGDTAANGPDVKSPTPPPPSTVVRAPGPPGAGSAPMALVGDPNKLSSTQLCHRECGVAFTNCAQRCEEVPCVKKCGDLAKFCVSECL